MNENIIKQQIQERNSRIENYIVNYLSQKNPSKNLTEKNSIDNQSKRIIYKPPLAPRTKDRKISNFRPKISRIHSRKELNSSSYYLKNNENENEKINLNAIDLDDSFATKRIRTIATLSQQKENKENLNINLSFTTAYTNNKDMNKSKNSIDKIQKNPKRKSRILNNINKNVNYFLKKIPRLFTNNSKKELNSYYTFKNSEPLSSYRSINNSRTRLNINIPENIVSYRKKSVYNMYNSFNGSKNYIKTNIENHNCSNSSKEKLNTINTIKTIKRIKKPKIFIIENNTANITNDQLIYNKKNNFSSFSQEKHINNANINHNKNRKSFSQEKYRKYFLNYNRNQRNTYNGVDERKTKELNLNLEDFLLIIQKFEIIKLLINSLPEKINNVKQVIVIINSIKIKVYDLYKFYFGCSFEGAPENLFFEKNTKINLHYYSIIFILSLALIYNLTNKVKMTQDYFPQIINLFNFQQKLFLLLSDMVIHNIRINSKQKIWMREIMNILNNKLMFNSENQISDMKKIILNSYYLMNEILSELKIKNENNLISFNEQEDFLMNFYFRNNLNSLFRFDMNNIEELFNNKIFNVLNTKNNSVNIKTNRKFSKNKYFNKILNSLEDTLEVIIPTSQNNSSKRIPKIPYLNFASKKEYTLILDLDETMIHFKFIDINQGLGKIHLRPGLENFLEVIKEFYEIIVFTSATKEYADIILDTIELKGNNKYFSGRLYREHNIQIGQKFYKDLSKVGRDLSRTIIVDNFNQCFKFQKENGILISSFYGDNIEDKALVELQKILIKIYNEKNDVRKSINKYQEDIFRKVSYLK